METTVRPTLYFQYGLTLLVLGFLITAFWSGRLDSSIALPLIIGYVTAWLPTPVQAVMTRLRAPGEPTSSPPGSWKG